jgi:hypothetical protein
MLGMEKTSLFFVFDRDVLYLYEEVSILKREVMSCPYLCVEKALSSI